VKTIMNEFQEVILDQLMAAEVIGEMWSPGPLQLAVEALRTGGLTQRKQVCRALGFPLVLCHAIEGASEVLPRVDDVRSLAISIFSEVSPQTALPRYNARQYLEIADWTMRQALLHFDQPHPICLDILRLLDSYLDDEKPMRAGDCRILDQQFERAIFQVPLNEAQSFSARRLVLTTCYFAMHALRHASDEKSPEQNTARACRDTARLVALTGGPETAVPYCLELVKMLEL
jgi:hypothetical protein